jgi:hypothetical protein
MARGIYRVRDPKTGRVDFVCVRYEAGADLEIEESHYIAQGYKPPLKELPWKEDYKEDGRAQASRN